MSPIYEFWVCECLLRELRVLQDRELAAGFGGLRMEMGSPHQKATTTPGFDHLLAPAPHLAHISSSCCVIGDVCER
jgi:hypothetical protein